MKKPLADGAALLRTGKSIAKSFGKCSRRLLKRSSTMLKSPKRARCWTRGDVQHRALFGDLSIVDERFSNRREHFPNDFAMLFPVRSRAAPSANGFFISL